MNIVRTILIAFSDGAARDASAQTDIIKNTSTFSDSRIWRWVAVVADEKTSAPERAAAYEKVLKFPLDERIADLQRKDF